LGQPDVDKHNNSQCWVRTNYAGRTIMKCLRCAANSKLTAASKNSMFLQHRT